MTIEFDKNCYNPLYWHLKKYITDPSIRYIHVIGGSSAGKTHTITQVLSETILTEDVNVKVFRKESTTLWDTVYKDFEYIVGKLNEFIPVFKILDKWINRGTKYQIKFGGLDDPEKAKGLSQFKYIFLNELSKFLFTDFKEIKRRMRGIFGQTCITDCNPISEQMWLNTEVIEKDTWIDLPTFVEEAEGISQLGHDSYVKINTAGNTVLIKTTYKDNYWIVGHPVEGYGMVDENTLKEFEWMQKHSEYDYMVYGKGEFGTVKTGNEFWRAFDINKHVRPVRYEKTTTIHVSIDNNVHPYIAISFWQGFLEQKIIRQVHEIKCEDPNNTASRAGQKALHYLQSIGYDDVVFIYGDYSTKNANTIDEKKRSFYDLFEEQIKEKYQVRDRVSPNTSVAMKGEFINALYNSWQGWTIEISEHCRTSISDYIDVKTNAEGGMLKKKYTDKLLKYSYELNGHFSDTKKDFICEFLYTEFNQYQNKGGSNYQDIEIGSTGQNQY